MGYQVRYLLSRKTKLLIQYGDTDDFVIAKRNNRRLNVVRSEISQMPQVNVRSAVNKEIARSHNFDAISK